jgi:cell division protein FtsB
MIKPNRGREWLDWQRKLLAAAKWTGLAAILVMLGGLLFGEMGMSRYFQLRSHAEQLEHELAELQRLNAELRTDLDRVQYDSVRLEELAREQLGYVRKGETVYQLAPGPERDKIYPGRRP